MATPAVASTLTLTDTFGGTETIWTLDVQTSCNPCAVTLSGYFKDPGAGDNAYTGAFIDSVQWVISNPNVNPTNAGFTATNADPDASWSFAIDASLSGGNQCNGGAADAVCGEWITGTPHQGYGPIATDSTLTWTFMTTFENALPADLVAGNIRAAFNTGELNKKGTNYKNLNVFSPGGGTFEDGTTDGGDDDNTTIPEPATLTLLGSGLVAVASRLRRRMM